MLRNELEIFVSPYVERLFDLVPLITNDSLAWGEKASLLFSVVDGYTVLSIPAMVPEQPEAIVIFPQYIAAFQDMYLSREYINPHGSYEEYLGTQLERKLKIDHSLVSPDKAQDLYPTLHSCKS